MNLSYFFGTCVHVRTYMYLLSVSLILAVYREKMRMRSELF